MPYPPLSHDEFVARLLVDIWTLATAGRFAVTCRRMSSPRKSSSNSWSDDHLDAGAESRPQAVTGRPALS